VATSAGTLWLVATPIGSLDDLPPRAREVLASVDLILVEDTRRAGRLMAHAGVDPRRRLRTFHDHNEARRVPEVLTALGAGRSAALLSDAGTPVLSDPGYRLVRAARADGLRVQSVPGPSAFTAALAASGQPPLPATLVGFLPPRAGARRRRVDELAPLPGSLVVLLSPHRLREELEDLGRGLGRERGATLLAEISKLHERAVVGSLGELAGGDEVAAPRGEYVLVVGPAPEGEELEADAARARRVYDEVTAAGLGRGEALRATAARLGIRRNQVFALLEESAEDDA
jgi:16S rRNA (cytidine1402-2'-O)-methyltransferase